MNMNATIPPNHGLACEGHATVDIVDALQTMISNADAFMGDWYQRLDQQLESFSQTGDLEQQWQVRLEQWQREKDQWRAKRDQEERLIQEKMEQLTKAWLHLEAEQRRFLQMKQTQAVTSIALSSQSAPSSMSTSGMGNASDQSIDCKLPSSEPIMPRLGNASQEIRSTEHAVLQFQRLQKEIQSSRRV